MDGGGDLLLILAALVAGMAMLSLAALRAWEGWLDVRRLELGGGRGGPRAPSPARRRLELIDLKARVKRLEAIADGSDERI